MYTALSFFLLPLGFVATGTMEFAATAGWSFQLVITADFAIYAYRDWQRGVRPFTSVRSLHNRIHLLRIHRGTP